MAGLDSKNKHDLNEKYICPVCSLILRDPVQLSPCGHRVCQLCFNQESKKTLRCSKCHIEIHKDEELLDRGFKNEMQSLPIDCSLCNWNGILKNYQKHLDESHSHPKWEFCDQQFNSVEQLNEHQIRQCEKAIVYCPLKDSGCNQPIMRHELSKHYMTQQHQNTILKCICEIKSQLNISEMNINIPQPTTTTINDPATAETYELYETLNVLTGGISALTDDGQQLSIDASQLHVKLQAIEEHLSKLKLSIDESQGFLQELKYGHDILHKDAISLKEAIDDMQYVSYDGTLIWKITNFREKMMDAESERQTSINSPPFYSSSTGYKMRARLYLQGDGNARGSHMSLFFVLMRGPNDAILKFPFNYKVTFCMYDQTDSRRHIIDSFRPDIRSNSFQRPRSEMNIASGIPKFFPLSLIEQEGNPYARDDTMFIKVFIDFGNMPKTLVPYAMTLNPGLPINIQHELIKRETERQTQ